MPTDTAIAAFMDREMELLRARGTTTGFTREEYADRQARMRREMERRGISLVLASAPEAMCWLHGYAVRWYKAHSSTAWAPLQCTAIHVDHDEMMQFDQEGHRDLIPLTSVISDLRLTGAKDMDGGIGFMIEELRASGWLDGRVGLERWSPIPNPAVSNAMAAAFEAAGCEVVDATELVREVRRVKSHAEIATIEEATRICDVGMRSLIDGLRPGMTELEAWAMMMSAMVDAGGEPAGLHECVIAGPAPVGHSYSSRRPFQVGDYVLADPCGVVNRYHSNVGRQLSIGEPAPEAVRLGEIQAGAYDVLLSIAKVGMPIRDVNQALRDYYEDSGIWELRGWIGGYELGVAFPPDWVGEWLFTVAEETPSGVIEANTVSNFESVAHFCMIETIVYEEAGPRSLSTIPRETLVVATPVGGAA